MRYTIRPAKAASVVAMIFAIAATSAAAYGALSTRSQTFDAAGARAATEAVLRRESARTAGARFVEVVHLDHRRGAEGIAVRVEYAVGQRTGREKHTRHLLLNRPILGRWSVAGALTPQEWAALPDAANGS